MLLYTNLPDYAVEWAYPYRMQKLMLVFVAVFTHSHTLKIFNIL